MISDALAKLSLASLFPFTATRENTMLPRWNNGRSVEHVFDTTAGNESRPSLCRLYWATPRERAVNNPTPGRKCLKCMVQIAKLTGVPVWKQRKAQGH